MTTFKPGTTFGGGSSVFGSDENIFSTSVTFSTLNDFTGATLPAGLTPITPQMVAGAINDLLVANGWPAAQFMGTPVDEPLV
jgi:hypothetical protein